MSTLIPAPLRVTPHEQSEFTIDDSVAVVVPDGSLRPLAELFAADLLADTGLALPVREQAAVQAGAFGLDGEHAIVLSLSADDAELAELPAVLGISPHGGDPAAERYGLHVTGDSVRIWADGEEGLFRGLTTLRQLAGDALRRGPAGTAGSVPAQRITDGPRFAWRGLMLDVGRTFLTVEQVEQVIDMLAAYKLNVLHLHLTEDAGWRLEIPGRPKLTAVGGERALGNRPGGWYTTADFTRLVRYGARRHVTVLPEIDLPGHATAVLRSYPELAADGTAPEHPAGPVLSAPATLDLDVNGTAEFLDEVLTEVAALVPTPFLHIGGDEAFGMDHAAFGRFVEHAAATVRKLGKQPVGWQEIARAGIGPGDVVQYWFDRADEFGSMDAATLDAMGISAEMLQVLAQTFAVAGEDVGHAVRKGAKVMLSPTRYTYLDVPYAEPSAEPAQEATRQRVGLGAYRGTSVRDSLDWDPETLLTGTVPADSLAGVEAALWSETVEDAADAHFLLLPRLPGIAQKAWSSGSGPDWGDYQARLAAHGRVWQRRGWGFFRSSLIEWAD